MENNDVYEEMEKLKNQLMDNLDVNEFLILWCKLTDELSEFIKHSNSNIKAGVFTKVLMKVDKILRYLKRGGN